VTAASEHVITAPVGASAQPVAVVEWVPRDRLTANDWNPNRQAPPERRLLKTSILENGWSQPIVVREHDGGERLEIVDGFHRWQTSGDRQVAALTRATSREVLLAERDRLTARLTAVDQALGAEEGEAVTFVPIVRLPQCPPALARLATVRHNRARGTHHVLGLADIVSDLLAMGLSPDEIGRRLEMDDEEVDRLTDRGQMTKRGAATAFGNGWTV
jgi:hypothetical protein